MKKQLKHTRCLLCDKQILTKNMKRHILSRFHRLNEKAEKKTQ